MLFGQLAARVGEMMKLLDNLTRKDFSDRNRLPSTSSHRAQRPA
jgi:hypothetical protein